MYKQTVLDDLMYLITIVELDTDYHCAINSDYCSFRFMSRSFRSSRYGLVKSAIDKTKITVSFYRVFCFNY